MLEFLITHWEGIAAIIGSIIAYIAGRNTRKTNALNGMQESYAKFVEDQDKRYEVMQKQIESLQEEVQTWKKKYKDLASKK